MSDSNPLDAFRFLRLNLKWESPYWLDEPIYSVDGLFARMGEAQDEWEAWFHRKREKGEAEMDNGPIYPCVRISSPNSNELRIGLAGERWFIDCFSTNEQGRRYLEASSLGHGNPELLLEFNATDCVPVSQNALIPAEAGRQVGRTWLETGLLWDQVDWEIQSEVVWDDPFDPGAEST